MVTPSPKLDRQWRKPCSGALTQGSHDTRGYNASRYRVGKPRANIP